MKLSEDLTQSSKLLAGKGFSDEGKLLEKIAKSKLEAYVVVANGMEEGERLDREFVNVFISESKAKEATMAAMCKYLRKGNSYLFYALDGANRQHKKHSKSDVSKKASSIFGTQIEFSAEKFKLPKEATDEQLIEFTKYLGYTPFVLQKIKLEV